MPLLAHGALVEALLERGCSQRKGVADRLAAGIHILDANARYGVLQVHRDEGRGLFGQHRTGWPWIQRHCLTLRRPHYYYRPNTYKLQSWLYESGQNRTALAEVERKSLPVGFTFDSGGDIVATISLSTDALTALATSPDKTAQALARQVVDGRLTTHYRVQDEGCRAYAKGRSIQILDTDTRRLILREEDGWQSIDIVDCHPTILSTLCGYFLDRETFAALCKSDGITTGEAKEIRRGFYNGLGVNGQTMLFGDDGEGGTHGKRIENAQTLARLKLLRKAIRKMTGKVPSEVHDLAVEHVQRKREKEGWFPRSEYPHELQKAKIVILSNLDERRAIDALLSFLAAEGVREIVYLSDGLYYKGPRFDAVVLSSVAREASGIALTVAYKA